MGTTLYAQKLFFAVRDMCYFYIQLINVVY